MKVDIVQQPPMRVAAVRHLGAYTTISEAFEKLSAIAATNDLFTADSLMLGLYHDDPSTTAEKELRSDAALTLNDGVKAPKGSAEMTVPAGRYARLTYTGPYDGLPEAWSEIMGWLEESGEQAGSGVSYELYRNDPSDTAPEDLITELYLPLA